MAQPEAVNPGWRKSSYSHNGGGDCVEAAHAPGVILVRDTKDNGTGRVLHLTPRAWTRLTHTIRTTSLS
jgi:hypothetical protein